MLIPRRVRFSKHHLARGSNPFTSRVIRHRVDRVRRKESFSRDPGA